MIMNLQVVETPAGGECRAEICGVVNKGDGSMVFYLRRNKTDTHGEIVEIFTKCKDKYQSDILWTIVHSDFFDEMEDVEHYRQILEMLEEGDVEMEMKLYRKQVKTPNIFFALACGPKFIPIGPKEKETK